MSPVPALETLVDHYSSRWKGEPRSHQWPLGPMAETAPDFRVLEFASTAERGMWTYATAGMSLRAEPQPLELHLFAPTADPSLIELMTVVAHYHLTGAPLGLGHTVNFGRPWLAESVASHGLVSLPYLDGPELEWSRVEGLEARFLWLIPITERERDYRSEHGLEALERVFDAADFDYLDPGRESVV